MDRSCHRSDGTPKVGYLCKRHAKKAVRELKAEGMTDLHVYRCPLKTPDNHGFHIGHIPWWMRDEDAPAPR